MEGLIDNQEIQDDYVSQAIRDLDPDDSSKQSENISRFGYRANVDALIALILLLGGVIAAFVTAWIKASQ